MVLCRPVFCLALQLPTVRCRSAKFGGCRGADFEPRGYGDSRLPSIANRRIRVAPCALFLSRVHRKVSNRDRRRDAARRRG